jgi:hypothetical protein
MRLYINGLQKFSSERLRDRAAPKNVHKRQKTAILPIPWEVSPGFKL